MASPGVACLALAWRHRHRILGLSPMGDQDRSEPVRLTDSQREWLRVRQHLREHRYELAVSVSKLTPDSVYAAGTPLLSTVDWMPAEPIALSRISLQYVP